MKMIVIYTLGFICASAYNMLSIIVNKDEIGAAIFMVTIVIWVLSIINMQKTNKVTRDIKSWDIEHSKTLETKHPNITNYLDTIRQNGYLASEVDNVITDEVIDSLTWRGKQSVLSATFTALGVLGTFLGLATGLGHLGRTTSDILANIDKLIPAITLAFSTSIVGLALSTLYNLTYRVLESSLFKSIDDLKKRCSIHGVDAPETVQGLSDTLNKFCNNAMIVVQKMNDMSKESEERMIKALEVFKSDVDDKLEAYRKMLDEQNTKSLTENKQIIELYRDETLNSMKEQLDKYRKDLSDWSDKLREQQDSTDQSISMLVEYGENTVKNIEEVSKRIDSTYDKLSTVNSEITDAVNKLSDNTTDLKAAIEKSDETIKEHLTGIVDSVNKSTQVVEATSEIINQQVSAAGVISDKLDTANGLLGEYTERISDMTVEMDRVLTSNVERASNAMEESIDKASVALTNGVEQASNAMTDGVKQATEAMTEGVDKNGKLIVKATEYMIDSIDKASSTIESNFEKTSELLVTTKNEVIESLDKNVKANSDLVNTSAEKASALLEDATTKSMEAMSKGVTEMGKKLTECTDYSSRVLGESVNSATNKIDDTVKQATESIDGSVKVASGHIDESIIKSGEAIGVSVQKATESIEQSIEKNTQVVDGAITKLDERVGGYIHETQRIVTESTHKIEEKISDSNNQLAEARTALTESTKSFTNEATRTINQARGIVSDFDTSFRDNVKATGDTLKSNVDDVIRTTGNRLKEMGDRKFESVSADLEKIVEQEFKSVEAIQKLTKSIGETMLEHKQFTQDLSRESRNSRDNIETSKAISEMMNKDLDIIVKKLTAISEIAEGMVKHDEE